MFTIGNTWATKAFYVNQCRPLYVGGVDSKKTKGCQVDGSDKGYPVYQGCQVDESRVVSLTHKLL
ncbi:hypothetical protein LCGC14_2905570 [marine sediment metagenome]|uniref:Uncharacterized protein n=1 Tax=marine sediment metagenome TaxID=412755 RepID=A0A0F8XTK2_9ZZZZ